MEFVVIGLITAFNMLVILAKINRNRYQDAALDSALLITVTILFSGSYGGMVVAMIASLVISLYLFANPPSFFHKAVSTSQSSGTLSRFKKELNERIERDRRQRAK